MPRRPCLGPGPSHLAEPNSSRCAVHKWKGNWPTTSATSRGYGHAWRQTRELVLQRDQACTQCGSTQRLEVDHITPKSRGGTDHLSNLQVLCHTCHEAKTNSDHPRWR